METDTLPKLLRRNYQKYGRRVALKHKEFGYWVPYSWEDYYLSVKHISLGLMCLGLQRGDKVAIIGDNEPQWYWAELATQAAGGVAVGIFTDCLPDEIKYITQHSDARFVFAHDQEQVDKVLSCKQEIPEVKKVIYWDPKGLWFYEDPLLMSLDQLMALGKQYEQEHPGAFEEALEGGKGEEIAILCYTSGTTGLPKGVMQSHESLIRTTSGWFQVDPWYERDDYLSFLPPAWAAEQFLGITGSLLSGLVVTFPEEPETVQQNIREIGPQVVFYSPRNWELVAASVQARVADATWLKRLWYRLCLSLGYRVADIRLQGKRLPWWWWGLYKIANGIVFRPLRDKLGLLKVRYAYTAGSMISPDIIRYFQAIGVNLKQLFGTSEAGLSTCHRDGAVKPETVGPPLPGVDLRLSPEGEVLVRGPGVMLGYYKNPEASRAKLVDGWYHSGDAGYIDPEGHLIIIDRLEDLAELADGDRFSPQYIETRLRFSPYIKDALAVGGKGKPYVSAIINIDFENVGRWAERHRLPYTTYTDLSQKREVAELVRPELERVNRFLPPPARVRRFVLLHKEFDPDEAELTRTRKVRRSFMEERYSYLLEAMYGDRETVTVEAPVTYRDGRKGMVTTGIKVWRLEDEG